MNWSREWGPLEIEMRSHRWRGFIVLYLWRLRVCAIWRRYRGWFD